VPLRALLPLATALPALALLLAPAPSRALGSVTSAHINGFADNDVEPVASASSATTSGPNAAGTASASGDLASGLLTAETEGTALGATGFLDATATAELTEVLFLIPDAGSPVTPVPFTLFMDVDGVLLLSGSGTMSPSLQLAVAQAAGVLTISGLLVSNVSSAALTATRRVEASGGNVLGDLTTADLADNVTGDVGNGVVDVRLTATAMVTPNSAFQVRAYLAAVSGTAASFSSTADLSQTGRIGVVVPAGYTLSSNSGVFLSVPEPSAPAPLALAVLALLAARRRQGSATE